MEALKGDDAQGPIVHASICFYWPTKCSVQVKCLARKDGAVAEGTQVWGSKDSGSSPLSIIPLQGPGLVMAPSGPLLHLQGGGDNPTEFMRPPRGRGGDTVPVCGTHVDGGPGGGGGGFWETGAQVKARGKQGWAKP